MRYTMTGKKSNKTFFNSKTARYKSYMMLNIYFKDTLQKSVAYHKLNDKIN